MIGEKIRLLREQNNYLLRQLAAQLEIDTALLSKMERGERFFKREDIEVLSSIFNLPKEELLTIWLADKVVKTLEGEDYKIEALNTAIKCLHDNE